MFGSQKTSRAVLAKLGSVGILSTAFGFTFGSGNLYIWMDTGSSSHPSSANVSDWTPHLVEQFQGQEIVQVRSGTGLLAAITKDGRLYMWYVSQPFM